MISSGQNGGARSKLNVVVVKFHDRRLQHVRATALIGQWWANLISVVFVFEVKEKGKICILNTRRTF